MIKGHRAITTPLFRLLSSVVALIFATFILESVAFAQVIDPDPSTGCTIDCGFDIPTVDNRDPALPDPEECSDCGSVDPEEAIVLVPVSTAATSVIVAAINDTDRGCAAMQPASPRAAFDQSAYEIDCLAMHYRKAAKKIPNQGEYKAVRAALEAAADKLDQIVVANQDPDAEIVEIRERGKNAAPIAGTVRPIKPEKLASARKAAAAVVEETALLILRSGEIPTRRNVHFTEIAHALSGALVVLRAA